MVRTPRHAPSRALPNVLLVTTDTQRCDTLACMGNPHAHSPHLDRLAAEGTMFTDAYTACPVCMPARCSLVTGMHTQTHGAIENGIDPHDHLVTFPALLRDAGYKTIMVGKNHVGPLDPGYDHACIISGEKGSTAADPYTEFLASHNYQRGAIVQRSLPAELHMESFLVDQTIAAIEETRSGSNRPFFAHCSLLSPHAPIDPPDPWDTRYADAELPPINYRPGELDDHPDLLHEVFRLRGRTATNVFFTNSNELNMDEVDRHRRVYYGLAAFCDYQIGRLIDYLDTAGLREQTLVIFTSDHGTQLFDHGFDDKHCYFDASWRVPMIFSMPGTLPQNTERGMASWVDIAPSILAAAGLSCDSMQGFDLFTPLKIDDKHPRHCAASTLYTSSALVTSRWKFEWYFEQSTGRLYDRRADPAEQSDLFNASACQDARDHLLNALLLWRAETIDVQWIRAHTRAGGPVAQNVADHTSRFAGTDAELRLSHRIAQMETRCEQIVAG